MAFSTPDFLKDTHREKAPSNKTLALTESMNMSIWVAGTLNQVFVRGSETETIVSVTGKTPIFVIGPILYSPFYLFNIGFNLSACN